MDPCNVWLTLEIEGKSIIDLIGIPMMYSTLASTFLYPMWFVWDYLSLQFLTEGRISDFYFFYYVSNFLNVLYLLSWYVLMTFVQLRIQNKPGFEIAMLFMMFLKSFTWTSPQLGVGISSVELIVQLITMFLFQNYFVGLNECSYPTWLKNFGLWH